MKRYVTVAFVYEAENDLTDAEVQKDFKIWTDQVEANNKLGGLYPVVAKRFDVFRGTIAPQQLFAEETP